MRNDVLLRTGAQFQVRWPRVVQVAVFSFISPKGALMIADRHQYGLIFPGLLGCLFLAQQAAAACKLVDPGFVAQDVLMDMGQVVILPGTPVGGVIKELIVPMAQRPAAARCDGNGGSVIAKFVNNRQNGGAVAPGLSMVFPTDVAGVGVRIYRESEGINDYYPFNQPRAPTPAGQVMTLGGGTFRVELIKTAMRTGSGMIAPMGTFTTYYLDGDGPGRPALTSTFVGSGTTVVSASCKVATGNNGNIAVNFDNVANSSFTGLGSRAGNRDFTIQLSCQGSNVAESQSMIGIRLNANQADASFPGVLKLAGGASSATRIGIELVRRDGTGERAIRFNETLNIGNTVMGNSSLSLPLRARYIQTQAGAVGAGQAKGEATFTIVYN